MKCDFFAGQRVVCVDDDWPENIIMGEVFPPRVPMLNEVLTITEVNPCSVGTDNVFLTFAEIPSIQSTSSFMASVGYTYTHFRPLQERKTDISIFKAMLTPAGKVVADA